jgi:hypothetical protein
VIRDWTPDWARKGLLELPDVVGVTLLGGNVLEIVRRTHGTFHAATTAATCLDGPTVDALLSQDPRVRFVARVPKDGFIAGSALQRARFRQIGIGTLADLLKAAGLADPTAFQNKEVSYVERMLRQHSRIREFSRVDDRRYQLTRSGLSEVTVVFLHHYDLTADGVRQAVDTYGGFSGIVKANPNGRITPAASQVAAELGLKLFYWSDFLGALHKPWT